MDADHHELGVGRILKYLPFMAHILQEILIIPFHDEIQERMFAHTGLDEDIFPEFFRIIECMEYLLFHPIFRYCQIGFKKYKNNMIHLRHESQRIVRSEKDINIVERMNNLLSFLMSIRVNTKQCPIWKESSYIRLDLLYPHAHCIESLTMTITTFTYHSLHEVALMAEEILLRTGMIRESNIAVWTEWEISTILTDPGSSRTSSIIEESDFFSLYLRSEYQLIELIRYEWGMEKTIRKADAGEDLIDHKFRCNIVRFVLYPKNVVLCCHGAERSVRTTKILYSTRSIYPNSSSMNFTNPFTLS